MEHRPPVAMGRRPSPIPQAAPCSGTPKAACGPCYRQAGPRAVTAHGRQTRARPLCLWLAAACVLAGAMGATAAAQGAGAAQDAIAPAAVPYYTPGHFMQGLHRDVTAPAAAEFSKQAARLEPSLRTLCASTPGAGEAALAEARMRWSDAMRAWDGLAALAIGPLIERRSLLHIDFTPTRPALIGRAIEKRPAGAAALEKIGTPAKGLPALEWLLWTKPVGPRSPACAYAAEVAADVGREAAALARAFEAAAGREWSKDDAASTAMGEAINQWLAGLERLRWQDIERPLRAAQDGGGKAPLSAPAFPRQASGQSAASWSAQWQALHRVALQAEAAPPQPGGGLVTIETYLRGRGLNSEADALRRAVQEADTAMRNGLSAGATARLLAAAKALADLKRVLEARVAPALEVSIGFSSADGD